MKMKKARPYCCCLLIIAMFASNLASNAEAVLADIPNVPTVPNTWISALPSEASKGPAASESDIDNPAEQAEWYYSGSAGKFVKGRRHIGDQYYFFDGNGRMLTGWITWEDGPAENFTGAITSETDDLYYCTPNGYMVKNCFMELPAPESSEDDFEDSDSLDGQNRWYYFDSKGRLKRDCRTEIDGKEYCFSKTGRMLTGWVFNHHDSEGSHQVPVDEETSSENFEEFKSGSNSNYVKNFRYCDETGAVVKDDWVTVMPYDEAIAVEPIPTKFRFDKKGQLLAGRDSVSGGMRLAKSKEGGGSYALKSYDTPVVLKELDGKTYAFDKNGKPVKKLTYVSSGGSRYKKGFYCFNDANAACVGEVTVASEESSRSYSYYFAEKSGNGYTKGQGYSGVHNGKLYYQGLAIQADPNEEYELVYVEALDKKSNDTGLFIVDEDGKIKKGSLRLSDGYKYQIKKAGNRGYKIFRLEDDKTKTEITPDMVIAGDSDGADACGDGMYRYVAVFDPDIWR